MSSPVWTKVTALLPFEPEEWSSWAEVFSRHGLEGTVQTDTPPTMSAYLPPGQEGSFDALNSDLLLHGAVEVTKIGVPEEDWSEAWKQFFKPRKVGPFVVRPTWEPFELKQGEIEIVLDPGQAFGTGDHPTTRMCLELLASALQQFPGASVADIGCGSGILSVGAAKLGASSVSAVDSDPVSVESSRENADRNGVTVKTFVGRGFEPVPPGQTFHVVVSNIISAALIGIAFEASKRVESGGVWIVSGIIVANWNDVLAEAEKCGFTLMTRLQEGEWVAATLQR